MADEVPKTPAETGQPTPDAGGLNSGTPAPQQPPAVPPSQPADDPNNPPWLADRLERAERGALKKFLDGLGVTSADDLKNRLQRVQQIEESQKTEAERLQSALETEKQAREKAEQALQAAQEQQRQLTLENAIRAAAMAARAENPDDVIMRAREAHGEAVEALLNDKGAIDDTHLKALVDTIREERPKWFIGTGPGSPSNNNGRAPEPDATAKATASRAAEHRARQTF